MQSAFPLKNRSVYIIKKASRKKRFVLRRRDQRIRFFFGASSEAAGSKRPLVCRAFVHLRETKLKKVPIYIASWRAPNLNSFENTFKRRDVHPSES